MDYFRLLRLPGRHRIIQGALPGGSFFEGQFRDMAIGENHRNIQPLACSQKIKIGCLGVAAGETDEKGILRDRDRNPLQRLACCGILAAHLQHADLLDIAQGAVLRYGKHQRHGMRSRQCAVEIFLNRHRQLHFFFRYVDLGANR